MPRLGDGGIIITLISIYHQFSIPKATRLQSVGKVTICELFAAVVKVDSLHHFPMLFEGKLLKEVSRRDPRQRWPLALQNILTDDMGNTLRRRRTVMRA